MNHLVAEHFLIVHDELEEHPQDLQKKGKASLRDSKDSIDSAISRTKNDVTPLSKLLE